MAKQITLAKPHLLDSAGWKACRLPKQRPMGIEMVHFTVDTCATVEKISHNNTGQASHCKDLASISRQVRSISSMLRNKDVAKYRLDPSLLRLGINRKRVWLAASGQAWRLASVHWKMHTTGSYYFGASPSRVGSGKWRLIRNPSTKNQNKLFDWNRRWMIRGSHSWILTLPMINTPNNQSSNSLSVHIDLAWFDKNLNRVSDGGSLKWRLHETCNRDDLYRSASTISSKGQSCSFARSWNDA